MICHLTSWQAAQAKAKQQQGASAVVSASELAHAAEQTEVDEEEEDAVLEEEQNEMFLDNVQAEFDWHYSKRLAGLCHWQPWKEKNIEIAHIMVCWSYSILSIYC